MSAFSRPHRRQLAPGGSFHMLSLISTRGSLSASATPRDNNTRENSSAGAGNNTPTTKTQQSSTDTSYATTMSGLPLYCTSGSGQMMRGRSVNTNQSSNNSPRWGTHNTIQSGSQSPLSPTITSRRNNNNESNGTPMTTLLQQHPHPIQHASLPPFASSSFEASTGGDSSSRTTTRTGCSDGSTGHQQQQRRYPPHATIVESSPGGSASVHIPSFVFPTTSLTRGEGNPIATTATTAYGINIVPPLDGDPSHTHQQHFPSTSNLPTRSSNSTSPTRNVHQRRRISSAAGALLGTRPLTEMYAWLVHRQFTTLRDTLLAVASDGALLIDTTYHPSNHHPSNTTTSLAGLVLVVDRDGNIQAPNARVPQPYYPDDAVYPHLSRTRSAPQNGDDDDDEGSDESEGRTHYNHHNNATATATSGQRSENSSRAASSSRPQRTTRVGGGGGWSGPRSYGPLLAVAFGLREAVVLEQHQLPQVSSLLNGSVGDKQQAASSNRAFRRHSTGSSPFQQTSQIPSPHHSTAGGSGYGYNAVDGSGGANNILVRSLARFGANESLFRSNSSTSSRASPHHGHAASRSYSAPPAPPRLRATEHSFDSHYSQQSYVGRSITTHALRQPTMMRSSPPNLRPHPYHTHHRDDAQNTSSPGGVRGAGGGGGGDSSWSQSLHTISGNNFWNRSATTLSIFAQLALSPRSGGGGGGPGSFQGHQQHGGSHSNNPRQGPYPGWGEVGGEGIPLSQGSTLSESVSFPRPASGGGILPMSPPQQQQSSSSPEQSPTGNRVVRRRPRTNIVPVTHQYYDSNNIDIAYIGGRSPLSLPTGLNSAGGVGGVEDESQQILPPRMVPMETSSMSRVVSDASSMDTFGGGSGGGGRTGNSGVPPMHWAPNLRHRAAQQPSSTSGSINHYSSPSPQYTRHQLPPASLPPAPTTPSATTDNVGEGHNSHHPSTASAAATATTTPSAPLPRIDSTLLPPSHMNVRPYTPMYVSQNYRLTNPPTNYGGGGGMVGNSSFSPSARASVAATDTGSIGGITFNADAPFTDDMRAAPLSSMCSDFVLGTPMVQRRRSYSTGGGGVSPRTPYTSSGIRPPSGSFHHSSSVPGSSMVNSFKGVGVAASSSTTPKLTLPSSSHMLPLPFHFPTSYRNGSGGHMLTSVVHHQSHQPLDAPTLLPITSETSASPTANTLSTPTADHPPFRFRFQSPPTSGDAFPGLPRGMTSSNSYVSGSQQQPPNPREISTTQVGDGVRSLSSSSGIDGGCRGGGVPTSPDDNTISSFSHQPASDLRCWQLLRTFSGTVLRARSYRSSPYGDGDRHLRGVVSSGSLTSPTSLPSSCSPSSLVAPIIPPPHLQVREGTSRLSPTSAATTTSQEPQNRHNQTSPSANTTTTTVINVRDSDNVENDGSSVGFRALAPASTSSTEINSGSAFIRAAHHLSSSPEGAGLLGVTPSLNSPLTDNINPPTTTTTLAAHLNQVHFRPRRPDENSNGMGGNTHLGTTASNSATVTHTADLPSTRQYLSSAHGGHTNTSILMPRVINNDDSSTTAVVHVQAHVVPTLMGAHLLPRQYDTYDINNHADMPTTPTTTTATSRVSSNINPSEDTNNNNPTHHQNNNPFDSPSALAPFRDSIVSDCSSDSGFGDGNNPKDVSRDALTSALRGLANNAATANTELVSVPPAVAAAALQWASSSLGSSGGIGRRKFSGSGHHQYANPLSPHSPTNQEFPDNAIPIHHRTTPNTTTTTTTTTTTRPTPTIGIGMNSPLDPSPRPPLHHMGVAVGNSGASHVHSVSPLSSCVSRYGVGGTGLQSVSTPGSPASPAPAGLSVPLTGGGGGVGAGMSMSSSSLLPDSSVNLAPIRQLVHISRIGGQPSPYNHNINQQYYNSITSRRNLHAATSSSTTFPIGGRTPDNSIGERLASASSLDSSMPLHAQHSTPSFGGGVHLLGLSQGGEVGVAEEDEDVDEEEEEDRHISEDQVVQDQTATPAVTNHGIQHPVSSETSPRLIPPFLVDVVGASSPLDADGDERPVSPNSGLGTPPMQPALVRFDTTGAPPLPPHGSSISSLFTAVPQNRAAALSSTNNSGVGNIFVSSSSERSRGGGNTTNTTSGGVGGGGNNGKPLYVSTDSGTTPHMRLTQTQLSPFVLNTTTTHDDSGAARSSSCGALLGYEEGVGEERRVLWRTSSEGALGGYGVGGDNTLLEGTLSLEEHSLPQPLHPPPPITTLTSSSPTQHQQLLPQPTTEDARNNNSLSSGGINNYQTNTRLLSSPAVHIVPDRMFDEDDDDDDDDDILRHSYHHDDDIATSQRIGALRGGSSSNATSNEGTASSKVFLEGGGGDSASGSVASTLR